MGKIYFYTILFIFSCFLFNNVFAGYREEEKILKRPVDDPMDTSTPPNKKPKRNWKDRESLSATDSEDSGSGRVFSKGSRFYHGPMIPHYQKKGEFHHGIVTFAPKGREDRFIKKHGKEIKRSLKKEMKHKRLVRGLYDSRYKVPSNYLNVNVPEINIPSPPRNTEKVLEYLNDPYLHWNTDKKNSTYLLPVRKKTKRKRRAGEPKDTKAEGPTESETESEPEYREKLKEEILIESQKKRRIYHYDSNEFGKT